MCATNFGAMLVTINGCSVAAKDLEELRRVLFAYAEEVRVGEPGCRTMRLLEDAQDPLAIIVYSEFDDATAYQAHLESAHVARLRQRLHPLMGETHHKTIFRPIPDPGQAEAAR